MVIFQPDRFLLKKQIIAMAGFINGKILDVGSGGTLRYKKFLNFSEYVTLDVDGDSNPDFVASVLKMPFSGESFDSIICTQVLGDIFGINEAIKEMARVLKIGGRLLVTESLINELHNEPNDFWRFTPFSFEKLAESNGLKIIKIEQRGGFWSSAQQNFIRYLIESLHLYKRKWLGNIFKIPAYVLGHLTIWLDGVDKSRASKKFAIGWAVIAQKVKN